MSDTDSEMGGLIASSSSDPDIRPGLAASSSNDSDDSEDGLTEDVTEFAVAAHAQFLVGGHQHEAMRLMADSSRSRFHGSVSLFACGVSVMTHDSSHELRLKLSSEKAKH